MMDNQMSAKNHAEQQEPRYTKAELNAEYCRGRIDGWEAAMSAPQGEAIYIVATGEVHEGLETYTRHDSPPPLCEFEKLYTAPQPYHFADASKMVPLTDEQIDVVLQKSPIKASYDHLYNLCRAIEAAHGITGEVQ